MERQSIPAIQQSMSEKLWQNLLSWAPCSHDLDYGQCMLNTACIARILPQIGPDPGSCSAGIT